MSNGYLINNYPDYFKGVCTSVGFVTVLLTMLNDKLPLSKIEDPLNHKIVISLRELVSEIDKLIPSS